MKVGVLAFQGCIEPHFEILRKLGVETIRVRSNSELSECKRLIMPGGESTTMLKLIHEADMFSALTKFAVSKPTWGICAGSILLAREVINPTQESLQAINIRAERNSYGSQLESFKAEVFFEPLKSNLKVDFIRAPRLEPISESVRVLASHNGDPVCLQEENVMASSFHVELGEDFRLHEFFLGI